MWRNPATGNELTSEWHHKNKNYITEWLTDGLDTDFILDSQKEIYAAKARNLGKLSHWVPTVFNEGSVAVVPMESQPESNQRWHNCKRYRGIGKQWSHCVQLSLTQTAMAWLFWGKNGRTGTALSPGFLERVRLTSLHPGGPRAFYECRSGQGYYFLSYLFEEPGENKWNHMIRISTLFFSMSVKPCRGWMNCLTTYAVRCGYYNASKRPAFSDSGTEKLCI